MSFASDNQYEPTPLGDDDEPQVAIQKKGPKRWYAVQVASGCEKRVKLNLEQRLPTLSDEKVDLQEWILRIEVPQTPAVKIRKDGSRQTIEEKVFPGYVLVYMQLYREHPEDDWDIKNEAWQVVKGTPNVINFVGSEKNLRKGSGKARGSLKPRPLSRAEVERIFKQAEEQKPVVKIDMAAGDKIVVLSGPFKDFEGEVIEVSPERSKLKALLSIFGRDTPVELEFNQVQKES